jgi:hypothetical protein
MHRHTNAQTHTRLLRLSGRLPKGFLELRLIWIHRASSATPRATSSQLGQGSMTAPSPWMPWERTAAACARVRGPLRELLRPLPVRGLAGLRALVLHKGVPRHAVLLWQQVGHLVVGWYRDEDVIIVIKRPRRAPSRQAPPPAAPTDCAWARLRWRLGVQSAREAVRLWLLLLRGLAYTCCGQCLQNLRVADGSERGGSSSAGVAGAPFPLHRVAQGLGVRCCGGCCRRCRFPLLRLVRFQEMLPEARLCHLHPLECFHQLGLQLFPFLLGRLALRVRVGDQHPVGALNETKEQYALVLQVIHGLWALVQFAPTLPQIALLVEVRHAFHRHLDGLCLCARTDAACVTHPNAMRPQQGRGQERRPPEWASNLHLGPFGLVLEFGDVRLPVSLKFRLEVPGDTQSRASPRAQPGGRAKKGGCYRLACCDRKIAEQTSRDAGDAPVLGRQLARHRCTAAAGDGAPSPVPAASLRVVPAACGARSAQPASAWAAHKPGQALLLAARGPPRVCTSRRSSASARACSGARGRSPQQRVLLLPAAHRPPRPEQPSFPAWLLFRCPAGRVMGEYYIVRGRR